MSLLADLKALVAKLEEAAGEVVGAGVDVAGGLIHEATELAKKAVDSVAGEE